LDVAEEEGLGSAQGVLLSFHKVDKLGEGSGKRHICFLAGEVGGGEFGGGVADAAEKLMKWCMRFELLVDEAAHGRRQEMSLLQ
jgi:hypothetical protein